MAFLSIVDELLEKMMQLLKEIMSRDVRVISPDSTLKEAAALMRDNDFGMLPVGENDRMIGAITDRDIAIRAVAEGMECDSTVRNAMSQDIIWCYEDDTVEKGAEAMSRAQVRRLPVVDMDKRLVGIVSLGDFAVSSQDIDVTAEALANISQP